MGLLQRIASAWTSNDRRASANDARVWGAGGVISTTGIAVTREAALQLDIVQGCLENLAGPISTLPLMVYRRVGKDRREAARDHPLFDLLHRRPNARQTAQEFRDEQQRHLALERNAYAIIVPDGDEPVGSLDPVHPSRINKIERGSDGVVRYWIRRLGSQGGEDVYTADQIWHLRKAPLTEDGLRGMPVYETSKEPIGRAIAVKEYGSSWFRNSGQSGGVLKHPGYFKTEDDKQNFLETWRQNGTGPNRHRDRLLTHGVEYTPLAVKNNEAQFVETMDHEAAAVARLWSMPLHRLQIYDGATHSNVEQQSIDFVMHTLAPWIVAWEQAASRDLLVGEEQAALYVEFNVAGLLRGDIKSQFDAFAKGRQWGWLSVNDIRRMQNMEPIEGGDEYLKPLNMIGATDERADDAAPSQPAS